MPSSESFERFFSTGAARKDLKRNSVRAFAYVLGSSGGEFILRVASTAILARIISLEHFGLFMMVTAVTAIADQFRDLGLSTATIQRDTITHHEVSNLFWINAAAGILLAIVVCAGAPLVAGYFNDSRLTSVTMVLAINFIFGGLTVQHEALLTRQMKHGQKSLVRLSAFFLSSILAIVLAIDGAGYWALVWREIARSCLIVVGAFWACPWLPGLPDRKTDVRALVGFGKDLTLTYFLGILSSSIDRFLIGRFFGPSPVALYRQPYQLVVAPMHQFMSPLYQVALPGLSMLQNEPVRFARFFQKVVSLVAMLSMPLNVFLAIYSLELTQLILGHEWIGAANFFRIFAIGGVLRSVVSTIGFVLVSRGNSTVLLKLGVANSLVMSALLCLGLFWGPEGVAVGEALTAAVMLVPWMVYSFKNSPVSIGLFLSALVRPTVASAFTATVLIVLRQIWRFDSPSVSLLVGAVSGIIALFASWTLLPGGKTELKTLIGDLISAARRKGVSVAAA